MREHSCKILTIAMAAVLISPARLAAAERKPLLRRLPTVREAQAFMEQVEKRLLDLEVEFSHADWLKATYINEDSELVAAKANERFIAATAESAQQAARFNRLQLPPELAR